MGISVLHGTDYVWGSFLTLDHYHIRSSFSSSHSPFRLVTRILPPTSFSRLLSATAPNNSFSWSSVTLLCSRPDLAIRINLFSTSIARDSFTKRTRPRRSAASGERIWARMEVRASAYHCQLLLIVDLRVIIIPSCCLVILMLVLGSEAAKILLLSLLVLTV